MYDVMTAGMDSIQHSLQQRRPPLSAVSDVDAARTRLASEMRAAGVRPGGVLLVHSALSSLGHVPGGADTVIDALLEALGPSGTLLLPTLSYLFVTETSPTFNVVTTPTNLGAIPAAALRRTGAVRSLHPTHSVAALGSRATELTRDHYLDTTPVGEHSPFRLLRNVGGQVAFLGCGTRCNTSIHGVEELLPTPPPYLFRDERITYDVTDAEGHMLSVSHKRHDFRDVAQRYERVVPLMPAGTRAVGRVGSAQMHVLDAAPMWDAALAALAADASCFTEAVSGAAAENHYLVASSDARSWRYVVAAADASAPAASCVTIDAHS